MSKRLMFLLGTPRPVLAIPGQREDGFRDMLWIFPSFPSDFADF